MTSFSGLKVLVVEDEGSVALLIEGMLSELGCEIVASTARLAEACKVASTAVIDLAVLDVNLDGELVFPAAEILHSRNIPFLFSTGYGLIGMPEMFRDCLVLRKPFTGDDMRQKIAEVLGRAESGRNL